jgi:hypothetical protein
MRRITGRCSILLPLAMAACVSSANLFPYLPPPAGGDRHTSFAPLGRAMVDTLARRGAAEKTRAAAAPLALTAGDGTGLAIEQIDVAAVIEGPLALTEMRLRFKNPEPRVLEGRFTMILPPDAAVSRFAMKNAEWLEAEIVARQRAREVYESYMKQNVDPALLEKGDGNSFSARVFPIEASGSKELIITYSQRVSAGAPYRVRLGGLPVVGTLRWDVRGGAAAAAGEQRGAAPGDIIVPVARGEAVVTAGDAFVARVVVPGETRPEPFERVTVLVDTSASRAAVRFRQADVVAQLIDDLVTREEDIAIEVVAFDQDSELIAAGDEARRGADVAAALLARGTLGASDPGAALTRWSNGRRVILVSDGIATAGARGRAALTGAVAAGGAARVDAVTVGGIEDRAMLEAIAVAGRRPGLVVDGEAGEVARALAPSVLGTTRVAVDGATWVWPPNLAGVRPGDEVVIHGRRGGGEAKPLRVTLGNTATTLAPGAGTPALVQRAVAAAEIERIQAGAGVAEAASRRAEIERLGLAHRLITSETSLLVLESEAEYARFCLGRTGLGDVLTVERGAIAVIDRHDGKPEPATGCAERSSGSTTTATGTNVPVPGRTFESVLGAAAGTQSDAVGVTFSGATSIENEYYVDGINVGGGAEVIAISGQAPMIDQTSTTSGVTIDDGFTMAVVHDDAIGGVVRGHPGRPNWRMSIPDDEPEPPPVPAYSGKMLTVMQHLRAGRRDDALALALRWQLDEPRDLAAIIALGEALEARGADGLAARAYGSILDLYGDRAELVRGAAERLDRLGDAGRALALTAYRRAAADRPDHITTYRLLAWAEVRAGQYGSALAQLERALGRADRDSVRSLLRDEMGLVGAAWAAAHPEDTATITARLARRGAAVAERPSLRFVLSWETDANDVDLHVRDARGGHAYYSSRELRSGGRLADDLTGGFGPEVFLVDGRPGSSSYRLSAHYYRRGPMGVGMGTVQVIEHDGAGHVTVEDRPFVIQNDDAYVDLGVVKPAFR